ncbi:MAG TPA: cytochrome c biogenesis protein CcsA [Woeseiaceae bacterium]|nr:cytochrome c biogenesis protein CcsA [Woeseiaceae bacterium]
MFQITIFFLYLGAAAAFVLSRLRPNTTRYAVLAMTGFVLALSGLGLHALDLYEVLGPGGNITPTSVLSLIGLQLALIALLGAIEKNLRGLSAALLLLAAILALLTQPEAASSPEHVLGWQMRTHVVTSLFAYGLLTVGAIVAIFALIQLRRLKNVKLSRANQLFAPLDTTESLLYTVTLAGFVVLALSVVSGFTFIEDLFAQHLAHKTILSLLALVVFGVLLLGRQFAGWRGRRAIYLYLAGFALLCLAYFGSRYVLEEILGRSWG